MKSDFDKSALLFASLNVMTKSHTENDVKIVRQHSACTELDKHCHKASSTPRGGGGF